MDTTSPTPVSYAPADERRPVNWAFVTRVGLIVGVIAVLVGFAGWEVYKALVLGGIQNKGDYYEVDLRAMSNFEMNQDYGTVADVPEQFRALSGKKVLLTGEIAYNVSSTANRMDRFELCWSRAKCCVALPKKQHFVQCRTANGKPVELDDRTFKVYGTLHVKVIREGGTIVSVFQMDVERAEPA